MFHACTGIGNIKAFAAASSCSRTHRVAAARSPRGRLGRRNPALYPPDRPILGAPDPADKPFVPATPPGRSHLIPEDLR